MPPTVRCLVLDVARGALISDLAHGWGQLTHAASGTARIETAAAHWVLPAGRALWLPPGLDHAVHCVTALSLRTLYFHPDALPALPESCVVLGLSGLLRELVLVTAERAPIIEDDGPSGRLVAVLRDELARAPQAPFSLPMPSSVPAVRLARRILDAPGGDRSIDQLVSGCGASRRTLERQFVRETGISLGHWRRQARLHGALLDLADGAAVGQVAAASGYASSSAFVQAFRSVFGVTPGRWSASRQEVGSGVHKRR